MRYVLDFGSTNAGGAPVFSLWVRLDDLSPLTPPAITEVPSGEGQYYFDVDWTTYPTTSISFKAEHAGIELSDVISSPAAGEQGSTSGTPGTSSLGGFSTVGVIVARAATQVGVLNLNPIDQAGFDPFGSADPNVVQMLEFLSSLGADLSAKLKNLRELTFTTVEGVTSYAMPVDYAGMVDNTGWDRTSTQFMDGPVSSQYAGYLKATTDSVVTNLPFRIQGNRLTFPVAPAAGLECSFEYVSDYWIQTLGSGTGPDANHPTSRTDYVLFDPLLVVRGLKLQFLQAKGRDTAVAYTEYKDRLDLIQGRISGGPTLSLTGGRRGERFLNWANIPDSGYGG